MKCIFEETGFAGIHKPILSNTLRISITLWKILFGVTKDLCVSKKKL